MARRRTEARVEKQRCSKQECSEGGGLTISVFLSKENAMELRKHDDYCSYLFVTCNKMDFQVV